MNIRRIKVSRSIFSILCFVALSSCGTEPILPYSVNVPPLVLSTLPTSNITDGRGRFREIYCKIGEDHGKSLSNYKPCEETLHRLDNEPNGTGKPISLGSSNSSFKTLIVPGIFGECLGDKVGIYSYARAHLKSHGYDVDVLPVSGRSSSSYNGKQIRDAIINSNDNRIVLIGYSKGLADILEAIVAYPELHDRIVAVVGIAGVVNGSPVADSLAKLYDALVSKMALKSCPIGDRGGVDSLRRSERLSWLSQNKLPMNIKYYSLAAFTDKENISAILRPFHTMLSRVDPRNDSQVVFYDAIIPGSTILGYANSDHWAVTLPFSQDMPVISSTLVNRNEFPREVLLETVIRFVEEDINSSQ